MIRRDYPANAAPEGSTFRSCEPILAEVRDGKRTQQLIVARRRKFSADLPIDVRAYLRDVAYVAREAADTNNPEVARLSLEVLARQAETLAAIADGVR